MDTETFVKIPDFDYEISDYGRVRKIENSMIMAFKNKKQNWSVRLTNNKKQFEFYVHRLVAQAFIPNPENKEIVKHIDNNNFNNNKGNLQWEFKTIPIEILKEKRKEKRNLKRKPLTAKYQKIKEFNKQIEEIKLKLMTPKEEIDNKLIKNGESYEATHQKVKDRLKALGFKY